MPLNIITFLLNRTVAANQGVDDQRANVLGLTFSMMNVGMVPSVIITQALARREVEAAAPPVTVTPVPTPVTPPAVSAVEVPAVVRLPYDAAELLLKGAGFKVLRQDEINESLNIGLVSGQLPHAHTPATKGSVVKVFVSIGFPMPDLTGKDLVTVKEAYSKTLNIHTDPVGAEKGTVSAQDVKAGDMVQNGAAITLTITNPADQTKSGKR